MCMAVTHGFALLQQLWAAPFKPDAKWHKGSLTAATQCGPAIFLLFIAFPFPAEGDLLAKAA